MENEELVNDIELLIASKREGDYWDFKEKYHLNKADFLHDILCMANNRADRNGYIIYGVRDNFDIVGIEQDENRKNQQNIIDFLKSKKFSGGVRPTIELKTLFIEDRLVDVLVVKNSTDTPYFLLEDYPDQKRRIRANYIYTRVGDTNTDIDKSADINHIEYLWKKRFLLNRPPLEQIKKRLLKKTEWIREGDTYYNVFNPEYTITLEYDEDRDHLEFYSYLMTNQSTTYGNLKISCFGTQLSTQQFVVLDGGRYLTIVPEKGFVGERYIWGETYTYRYFVKDSLDYILHLFLLSEDHEAVWARNRLNRAVLFFQNELEREMFEEFLLHNKSFLEEAIGIESDSHNWIECENEYEKNHIVKGIRTGKAMKSMLVKFREKFKTL
jgi:hypothetical protein